MGDQSDNIKAARARLAEKFGDDSKLKGVIKKNGAKPLADICEVNFFNNDNTVTQFKQPEVWGNIPNQTIIVFGNSETKNLKDVFSEIMTQLGPKQLKGLQSTMKMPRPQAETIKEEDGDDEAPELVEAPTN